MNASKENFIYQVMDFRAHVQTVLNTRRAGSTCIEKTINQFHYEYTIVGVCHRTGAPQSLTASIKWEEGIVTWFIKDQNGGELWYDPESISSICEAMKDVQ